jgi:hypothetical protein
VAGMLISALSAPIYAASLAAVALRRSRGFVTTPKGDASTRDTLITFRKHLLWALVFGIPLGLSFALGHNHFSMRAWSVASLIVCLLPVAIWRFESARERRGKRVAVPAAVQAPAAAAHLRPVPDLPPAPEPQPEPAPLPQPPLQPAAKPHRVVRFDRRPAPLPVAPAEPAREPVASGRRNHVVVRFDPPQRHEPEWHVVDQAEA